MTDHYPRVLIVDDTPAIHEDFRKILCGNDPSSDLASLREAILGTGSKPAAIQSARFHLVSAHQGQEAEQLVLQAVQQRLPFALAFVDMRMPPGWDGLETIEHLWRADSRLQVVICSAYSDHDWRDIIERLGSSDRLLILKKPFDPAEVLQCATALSHKWDSERIAESHIRSLTDDLRSGEATLDAARAKLAVEMRRREVIEAELQLALKLEAIGRLASGIAHEINTPVQYIGDSINFLRSAVGEYQELLAAYRTALREMQPPAPDDVLNQLAAREIAADFEFLGVEVPRSFARTSEGVQRVSEIVRAMKEFSHPPGAEHAAANLNHAIELTLLIARNEYKYTAATRTNYGALPEVHCCVGEINQVILNLIVNAAHAIAEAGRDATTGLIAIATQTVGEYVEIVVTDNGCGIPPDTRGKIFEPFFTTKEVGRGTGQGLAIAHSIIVERHGGRLTVDSDVGVGTSFHVWLPIHGSVPEVQ